ncbi:MAG TPA: phenylalanine--tRNA ligase subunit beta [Planktothrix sp.]|jgi:phenylalanyl-tRNA synthetase beta chain
MKLSFDWLCDYVDLKGVSPHEVAEKLTMGAFEVEEVRQVRPEVVGPIVVGEILEIYPHPDAKYTKIRVTKTRVAAGAEPLEIICGAANIEVGQRIPVALPGCRVIKSGAPFPISLRNVGSVTSNGMLCSPPELGLPGDAEAGILILAPSTELGTDCIELLHLKPDYVLFVEPRSNRGDALSVIGLAREVAALLRRPLHQPEWQLPEEELSGSQFDFKVSLEKSDDCPFFSTRVIADVTAGEAPLFIKRRLEAIDVRSVSGIVDITNYVMHEFGQPLHAYDFNRVAGHELSARRATKGERITTLDGKERELTDEVLVIADAKEVVAVAGVMGGKDSEISGDTKIIALEAAAFQPARVRRGSRLLGLSSDSSLRFERGVDVAQVARASDRAAYLIMSYCGSGQQKPRLGKLAVDGHDKVAPVHITCKMKELKRVLGTELTSTEVRELLTPLGFEVTKGECAHVQPGESKEQAVQVAVPSFRQSDVTRSIDIVEEVCRLWGYDNLPECIPPSAVVPEVQERVTDEVRDTLCGLGLNEAWLSSLTSGDESALGLFNEEQAVRVLNPLSADHQVLRQSLIPGLVKAASYNYDHGQQDVWLFEVGRTYRRLLNDAPRESDRFNSGTGVVEQRRVAGILMGQHALGEWLDHSQRQSASQLDFYQAKGVVQNLLAKLRVNQEKIRYFRSEKVPACMHPSRSCQIAYDNSSKKAKREEGSQLQILGWLGQLHPALSESLRFKESAFIFELNDLDHLWGLRSSESFCGVPATPSVNRDLTVDVFDAVDHAAVHSCISSAAGADLTAVELVSIYQQPEGQKSLSFRLTFQNPEKTLTAEEVDSRLQKVRDSLINRLSASFRA